MKIEVKKIKYLQKGQKITAKYGKWERKNSAYGLSMKNIIHGREEEKVWFAEVSYPYMNRPVLVFVLFSHGCFLHTVQALGFTVNEPRWNLARCIVQQSV